jgi:hypothetical protein
MISLLLESQKDKVVLALDLQVVIVVEEFVSAQL